jgi:hypothetical protein
VTLPRIMTYIRATGKQNDRGSRITEEHGRNAVPSGNHYIAGMPRCRGVVRQRRYALRHALRHRLEAGDGTGAWGVAVNLRVLETKCGEIGVDADGRHAVSASIDKTLKVWGAGDRTRARHPRRPHRLGVGVRGNPGRLRLSSHLDPRRRQPAAGYQGPSAPSRVASPPSLAWPGDDAGQNFPVCSAQ